MFQLYTGLKHQIHWYINIYTNSYSVSMRNISRNYLGLWQKHHVIQCPLQADLSMGYPLSAMITLPTSQNALQGAFTGLIWVLNGVLCVFIQFLCVFIHNSVFNLHTKLG
jgi:hypothetical protein